MTFTKNRGRKAVQAKETMLCGPTPLAPSACECGWDERNEAPPLFGIVRLQVISRVVLTTWFNDRLYTDIRHCSQIAV